MKSGKSTDSLMLLGKSYRFFVEIRRAFGTHLARTQCTLGALPVRFSREKPGALRGLLAVQASPHTTIKAQLERLLSSGVVGGGDVHVAFVVGDVRKRLAVQETGGHAAKVAPDVDGGARLHLRAKCGVCAVQTASGRKIAFGRAKNLTQRVVLGLACESIAAALSAQTLDVSRLVHQGNDLLKVLARDILALGNVAQRDPAVVNGQVSHCAKRVHSLCREHSGHDYSPSLALAASPLALAAPSSVVDALAAVEPLL